jgi:glycosyltransferase involved in cell wall biosynthesis
VKYEIVHSYTQTELVEEVLKMDIGIFPMFDIENSRARGILKATIYMSGEAAVISSAVGQSNELIQDGVNGMLATDTKSWEEKLEALITNPELRKRIAAKGLETVRAGFSLDQNFKKLQEVL